MMEVSATEGYATPLESLQRRTSPLTTDSREDVRRECEKLGELVVQARLESDHFGPGKAFAWEWLLEQYYRRRRSSCCFTGEILVSVANLAWLRQTCCSPRTIPNKRIGSGST